METRGLTDEELDEQIESCQERIETRIDLISDTSDRDVRDYAQTLLQRERMLLRTLREEKHYRATSRRNETKLELNSFLFKSSDQIRYETGIQVSGHNKGVNRAIKIEMNTSGGNGYLVTIYNLDGNHPVWQNNIQMAPKQMKIIESNENKIILKGFGQDMMDASFADYGLSIFLERGQVEKCILHLYDRNVDIEYLK